MRMMILAVLLIAVTAFSFDVGMVERVIDGDTLKVNIGGISETVRLLGVDTPESVKSGVEVEVGALQASDFTKGLEGKDVILTYGDTKRGYYGRLLAYVWVEIENGQIICWNVELIEKGHSDLYAKYKFNGLGWFKEVLGWTEP